MLETIKKYLSELSVGDFDCFRSQDLLTINRPQALPRSAGSLRETERDRERWIKKRTTDNRLSTKRNQHADIQEPGAQTHPQINIHPLLIISA